MIKLTKIRKRNIKPICRKLKGINFIGQSIIEKFEGKTDDIDILIYRDLFERFIYCFSSVRTILPNYNEKTFSKDYALALILRTSLLDFLTIAYLKTYYDEFDINIIKKIDYKSELGKFLCSHIRRIYVRLNKDYSDGHIIEKNYIHMINDFHRRYNFLFKENVKFNPKDPTKTLKYKNEIRNDDILKRLVNYPDNKVKNYSRAFGLYEIYSKYEHYGVSSRDFQKVDVNDRFDNIKNSLNFLIEGIIIAFDFFKKNIDLKSEEEMIKSNINKLKQIIN